MKFSKYNIVERTEYGLILFNSMNDCYVKIKNEEDIDNFNKLINSEDFDISNPMVKALYDRKYIVDDTVDEYEIAKEKVLKMIDSRKLLRILLYVTDQCNFRCVYCPEDHVDNKFSDELWDSLYRLIERKLKTNEIGGVAMSFFGGEPLLELKNIISFCERLFELKNNNDEFVFVHTVCTNGYLLKPNVYDKLTKLGVKHYQITIDGFAEQHNKTRPRVDGAGTWDNIIDNLTYINNKKDDVTINLRVNYSPINKDVTAKFINWVQKKFDNPKIAVSVEAVSADSGNSPEEYAIDFRDKDYQNIETELNDSERSYKKELLKPLRMLGEACPFSDPKFFAISTSGKISKCGESVYSIENPVGELLNNGQIKFYNNYKDWTENFETEDCPNCQYYPICAGRHCPHKKALSVDYRDDCYAMKELSVDIIHKYLREGFLN